MEGDLVKRLTRFGLSVNQAKVYLSIVQSASASVNTISKTTHIYRQDIYKILPKLEEMGLITKTIERPLTIAAIPMEEALNYIISIEQQKASERIKSLKADLKALANAIEEIREQSETTTQEEVQAIFLSTERARKNKLDVSYENARTKCDLVMNFELLRRLLPVLRKRFQALATNKVKTRLLVDTAKKKDMVKRTLEEIIPSTGDFTVKLTAGKITVKPYQIFDRKEVYVSTVKKTTHALPCMLWTNCKNLIYIYEENFEKNWNNRYTITICPKRDVAEEKG
jgi:sugar-specific transcriptional regulator TrmB